MDGIYAALPQLDAEGLAAGYGMPEFWAGTFRKVRNCAKDNIMVHDFVALVITARGERVSKVV